MQGFFKNENFYELSMKSYIFNRIKAELYMSYKCKTHHKIGQKHFECYYCKTDKILEERKLENELYNIDYAIDLIEVINRNMDKYLREINKILDRCLYD